MTRDVPGKRIDQSGGWMLARSKETSLKVRDLPAAQLALVRIKRKPDRKDVTDAGTFR